MPRAQIDPGDMDCGTCYHHQCASSRPAAIWPAIPPLAANRHHKNFSEKRHEQAHLAKRVCRVSLGLAILALWAIPASASDWPRFHGPDGSGISPDTQPVPLKWSETENLKWKCKLPGPGSSSPIVVGQRVFVTCWTGYGVDPENVGDQKNLRRHLICLDRDSGNVLWDKSVEPVLPEDPFSGMFTQHGYASHTPVSDGQRVYVFFGKTGVLAFDLDGNKLWQTSVGTGSGPHDWGTASSPILYKNLVIVTASAESKSLVALNKETGKEVWRRDDPGFSGTWGTPILVDCGKGRTDLVIAVPFKIWAFNPDDGKPRWQCDGLPTDSICASALRPWRRGLRLGNRAARRRGNGRPRRRRGRRDQNQRSLEREGTFSHRHARARRWPHLLVRQPHRQLH